jgi:hypothetical protein
LPVSLTQAQHRSIEDLRGYSTKLKYFPGRPNGTRRSYFKKTPEVKNLVALSLQDEKTGLILSMGDARCKLLATAIFQWSMEKPL